MKNVLYVGNALSNKGKTVTPIETLSEHLKEICHVKVASRKTNIVLRLLDMISLVLKNRNWADLVLIDTYSTLNFNYALIISLVCRVFKIDYIPILHGGNLEKRLKNNPKLSASIFKNAQCLISPSEFLKSLFVSYGYSNVEYIPNCIEIENYPFLNREIVNVHMLWVRSFSEIYNPRLAVLVLENLVEKNEKATLTMIGPDVDGSLKYVQQLAKERKLNVNFTGKLSKQDWLNVSKSHNVFINTTNFDNMPVSLIEAMALGLPIVSTNVGGIPSLIKSNIDGITVKANNAEAMANAILHLKQDAQLKNKIIANARQKAEGFDWNSVKPSWIKLLK
ncbi:glycosyltransferase family 4 protein [Winogradskyella ursingii]|uniref:glycosyltransferase family 4 protein n=1 Tax=Winogradskyella ursingii TaxID=2686079 RepID=UPI0015C82AC4|nr:glycosyltransferase family 4 protein [Winogradskyella ursingii]